MAAGDANSGTIFNAGVQALATPSVSVSSPPVKRTGLWAKADSAAHYAALIENTSTSNTSTAAYLSSAGGIAAHGVSPHIGLRGSISGSAPNGVGVLGRTTTNTLTFSPSLRAGVWAQADNSGEAALVAKHNLSEGTAFWLERGRFRVKDSSVAGVKNFTTADEERERCSGASWVSATDIILATVQGPRVFNATGFDTEDTKVIAHTYDGGYCFWLDNIPPGGVNVSYFIISR